MLLHALLHFVRGFAMGSADIVPGVSGGTIALVLGIYERFIASIRAGSKALTLLVRGDADGFRRWMAAVEWTFIIPLVAGIGVAFLTLARVIRDLLHDEPELMSAVFMGLVAGSVVIAWRLIRAPRAITRSSSPSSAWPSSCCSAWSTAPARSPSARWPNRPSGLSSAPAPSPSAP
jgi:uncharacterized membrane protein